MFRQYLKYIWEYQMLHGRSEKKVRSKMQNLPLLVFCEGFKDSKTVCALYSSMNGYWLLFNLRWEHTLEEHTKAVHQLRPLFGPFLVALSHDISWHNDSTPKDNFFSRKNVIFSKVERLVDPPKLWQHEPPVFLSWNLIFSSIQIRKSKGELLWISIVSKSGIATSTSSLSRSLLNDARDSFTKFTGHQFLFINELCLKHEKYVLIKPVNLTVWVSDQRYLLTNLTSYEAP